jgi:hypothetical protein
MNPIATQASTHAMPSDAPIMPSSLPGGTRAAAAKNAK